jgi:hypothetical protein
VVSGNAGNGHTGKFNTTGPICFVTCDSITSGFQCYDTTSRTIRINGSSVSCGSLPTAAARTPPYNVIDITAGTSGSDQDEIWWWGAYYTGSCNIPAGGLDF